MKIYINPACDIFYSSFYVYGFEQVFGKSAVQFSSHHFKQFELNNHFFAAVAEDKTMRHKIIIDFSDSTQIDQKAYEWCDIYAKINIAFGDLPQFGKLFSIGPSFGIYLYAKPATIFHSVIRYIKAKNRIGSARKFFSNYKAQNNRLNIDAYRARKSSSSNYVYFVSSLWKAEPETNAFRANFINAAKSVPGVNFEGGFAPRSRNDVPGFEAITLRSREALNVYHPNIQRSMVVFNTPAVLHCHGWKLGEFFAMGKAILSTSISREMPVRLQDGTHYLHTDGTQKDIAQKIEKLLTDPSLKTHLETAAASYYEELLSPQKVISQIIAHVSGH